MFGDVTCMQINSASRMHILVVCDVNEKGATITIWYGNGKPQALFEEVDGLAFKSIPHGRGGRKGHDAHFLNWPDVEAVWEAMSIGV